MVRMLCSEQTVASPVPLGRHGFCPVLRGFHTVQGRCAGRQMLPHRQVLPVFLCSHDGHRRRKVQQNRAPASGPGLAMGSGGSSSDCHSCERQRHPGFLLPIFMRRRTSPMPTKPMTHRPSRCWCRRPPPKRRPRVRTRIRLLKTSRRTTAAPSRRTTSRTPATQTRPRPSRSGKPTRRTRRMRRRTTRPSRQTRTLLPSRLRTWLPPWIRSRHPSPSR